MQVDELKAAVRDYERTIEVAHRLERGGDNLAHVLFKFFAMRSAFTIRWLLEGTAAGSPTTATHRDEEDLRLGNAGLPQLSSVRTGAEKLLDAVVSNRDQEVLRAIENMGVIGLCPNTSQQLSMMEIVARSTGPRSRLVPLTELALLAIEIGDLDNAKKYVAEMRVLGPGGWELYNLNVLEGLFQLNCGAVSDAICYLKESIRACQTDEHASLQCGVRAPNFRLAQALLEHGEGEEVLGHLAECKNVWQFARQQIDDWIDLIASGEMPDLQGSSQVRSISRPSCRLRMQYLRAKALEGEANESHLLPSRRKSPEEVIEARDKLLGSYERYISDKIGDAIRYLDKGLDAPTGPPCTDTDTSSQSESES